MHPTSMPSKGSQCKNEDCQTVIGGSAIGNPAVEARSRPMPSVSARSTSACSHELVWGVHC